MSSPGPRSVTGQALVQRRRTARHLAPQELVGQGTDACPDKSLCLYEDPNLNQAKAARIWAFPLTKARTDYTLQGHAAANQPSSGYLKAPDRLWAADLYSSDTCNFKGKQEQSRLSIRPNEPYNSLDGHKGRMKSLVFVATESGLQEHWRTTNKTVNLNDKVGCVSVTGTKKPVNKPPEAVPDAAPEIRELVGQGSGACPDMNLCLYEDLNLNQGKAARIWAFRITEARNDYTLQGHAAAKKPSSGYMKAPNLGWAAFLFPDYTCGFEGKRDAEGLSFRRNEAYNSLNGHNGRAKRYGYFNKKGKRTKDKVWGITDETLNLNDRAGCVTVGAYKNTDGLRPAYDGDMH
ncbi:hypothetical protein [Streptomyces lavendofoliae]|uniref:Uncharacterized protein n=1 Tax=Streptomyces lavendofoliae TaxID=67314 RepID=A0A918I4R6_9ACTN|nr:hypothetical protein [Streptomyces lavendofoliae]GGU67795.1 hypothetical protein GCM10010274_65270 [Streptomyces lavendofoliae]